MNEAQDQRRELECSSSEGMNLIVTVLEQGLKVHFANVKVSINQSPPDLSQPKWSLASKGIGGHPVILDIGGVNNVNYPENHGAHYDMKEIANQIGRTDGTYIGCGAGYNKAIPQCVNCELMANSHLGEGQIKSRYAFLKEDGSPECTHYNSNEFGLLGNFLLSDGASAPVIEVEVSNRIGSTNFVSAMRDVLRNDEKTKGKAIGLGGVFQVLKGKIKSHVMPDFVKEPFLADAAVNSWLKFFEVETPVTCLSVLVTEDMGLGLRLEHTHFFSEKDGGHYHHDTTPAETHYHGYFSVAEALYRIQRPSIPAHYLAK